MSTIYPVPESLRGNCYVSRLGYIEQYARSIDDSDAFWDEQARRHIEWFSDWNRVSNCDFNAGRIRWFEGATLNVAHNCIDRHLPHRAEQVAILWEGNEPGEVRKITYQELHDHVARLSNALVSLGIGRGDRVAIYLPMIPEAAFAMLACARIGAVHTVVFGGFSAESLQGRLNDAQARVLITANEGVRGTKHIPLKEIADKALEDAPSVEKVIVVARTNAPCQMVSGRDLDYQNLVSKQSTMCDCAELNSEDPLFILYTSGSTGKPKGLLHTQGGYLLYVTFTHRLVFDYRDGDIFCCAADVGWITGHSYVVYGPLSNGATTVMFESIPTYPDAGRYWDMIERHKINIFYTAPTAIRAIAKEDPSLVTRYDRSSLRILGTVGEPINPATWEWYHDVVGDGRCAVVDTWWQTETGGILISPLPGATDTKPGSATLPLFGVLPVVVDSEGKVIHEIEAHGRLCIARSWPGQARTIYGDHQRFVDTYLSTYPGFYFTGDGVNRDSDGYYWITGRVDDVLNVSGHRLGTAEIESALVGSGVVAEAAVVGMPHDIKGTGICAFCISNQAGLEVEKLHEIASLAVAKSIGAFARPDAIYFISGLPKTRSGKIMRRILRKIAAGEMDQLGDISTLAEPEVVDRIIQIVWREKLAC